MEHVPMTASCHAIAVEQPSVDQITTTRSVTYALRKHLRWVLCGVASVLFIVAYREGWDRAALPVSLTVRRRPSMMQVAFKQDPFAQCDVDPLGFISDMVGVQPTPSRNTWGTMGKHCLVTGASADHFLEVATMLYTAMQARSFSHIFVYDMGLESASVNFLAMLDGVVVRKPPLKMPAWTRRFERRAKAFKPWVMADVLLTDGCDTIMWADASIRFAQDAFRTAYTNISQSIALYNIPFAIAQWTHPGTYTYFMMDRLKASFSQFQSGSILFNTSDSFALRVFCAFTRCCTEKSCVLPEPPMAQNTVIDGLVLRDHRDDQSALNLALYRASAGQVNISKLDLLKPYIRVNRVAEPVLYTALHEYITSYGRRFHVMYAAPGTEAQVQKACTRLLKASTFPVVFTPNAANILLTTKCVLVYPLQCNGTASECQLMATRTADTVTFRRLDIKAAV